jgi:crossover junction endodeoxyribonuclease RusA
MTITLTLPYPISANRYWATRVIKRKGAKFSTAMTYVTPEAEQYKRTVGSIALAAGLRSPHTGRVALLVRLFPDRPQDWAKRARKDPDGWDDSVRCIDLGNCEKVLSDALNGIAWADDKQLRRIVLERCEPDEQGARVEVEITALSSAPIAPELFVEVA